MSGHYIYILLRRLCNADGEKNERRRWIDKRDAVCIRGRYREGRRLRGREREKIGKRKRQLQYGVYTYTPERAERATLLYCSRKINRPLAVDKV